MTTTSYNIYQQITSVRLATTVNLAGKYFNGALNNGVGATLTASSVGALVVDGVNAEIGDRLLLKDQTNTVQDGIYVVQAKGSAIALWLLERASDFQSVEQLKTGQYFSVGAGNTLSGSMYVLIEPLPSIIGQSTFSFVDVSNSSPPPPPPPGVFLAIANNFTDVADPAVAFTNLGTGTGQSITITDSDFTLGIYQIPVPYPAYIFCNALAIPGQEIRLPVANTPFDSPALGQGPHIRMINSVATDIALSDGTVIDNLEGFDATFYICSNKSSAAGAYGQIPEVYGINAVDGRVFLRSPDRTVYVGTSTSTPDSSVLGSITNPYPTLSAAIASITTASAASPFQIIMSTGDYSEASLALKPWIYINGHGSSLTVTGPVTLDPLWSTGGNALLENFYNADFQGNINLDFDAIAQTGLAVMTFDLINGASAFSYNITGSTAGTTICVFNQIVGYGSQQDINVTNCYGGMSNSAPNNINYTQSDAINGHVWNLQSGQAIGNVTIESSAGNLIYFSNALNCYGSLTLKTSGAGTMTAYPLRSSALGGVKFDSVGSGLNVTVDSYFLANPIIVGTPVITYGTLASGISADYPGPVNYIPVTPEVKGHLQGIDAALAGAGGVPPAFGEMFFQGNATVTTIAAANTPVKVNATYNSGILSNFSQATGTITYTDVPSRTVIVSADLTATYNGTAQNTSFYIALNGAVVAKSKQSTYIGAVTPANQANPCKVMLNLVTNDTLELWVENNDNTNDIIVNDLNFTVQSIAGFDAGSVVLAGENYLSLLGNTLTANPVNLSGTNVTGLLPLSNLADYGETIDGMSINGTSGVNGPTDPVISSHEVRLGNIVMFSVKWSFNAQALQPFVIFNKSYGGAFTATKEALGAGTVRKNPTFAIGDGTVQEVLAATSFGIRVNMSVASTSQDYIMEATGTYQVI